MRRIATSVAITDPLVKYQALLATGVYAPDPSQHRLARHLHKLYLRLRDYSPPEEFRSRLRQATQAIESARLKETDQLATENHPIRRNPLFARFFKQTEGESSLALTRVLTSRQAACEVDSPKGLFLSGDVGTGKSMLLDLLAEGLPTSRKRRWHFNTFMLYAFSKLERFRKSNSSLGQDREQYSLLWMAKEMIEASPILFLDEFQLPDRAASKLLSHLFIIFFQLGGVLVASSNRMPDELEKAIGVQYSTPQSSGLFKQVMMLGKNEQKGELFGETSDFAAFLEVLKARCDFWHMEGAKDWRRRESPVATTQYNPETVASGLEIRTSTSSMLTHANDGIHINEGNETVPDSRRSGDNAESSAQRPAKYVLCNEPTISWLGVVHDSLKTELSTIPWTSTHIVVYGRKIIVPRQYDGTSYWSFDELVGSFGPADYITLASTYHTFIVDQTPVLTLLRKNEARRFITFLDALYEARCKLFLRAEAGPDDLFFPETKLSTTTAKQQTTVLTTGDHEDATYSETVAEVFQDQTSPFRPNISTYAESRSSKYNPDQDSDFVLEGTKVDFSNTGAFTGEDERFAYKRASSRLWELCSSHWHERTGEWWQPLPIEARHWEGSHASEPLSTKILRPASGDVVYGPSIELDEPGGLQGLRLAALKKSTQ